MLIHKCIGVRKFVRVLIISEFENYSRFVLVTGTLCLRWVFVEKCLLSINLSNWLACKHFYQYFNQNKIYCLEFIKIELDERYINQVTILVIIKARNQPLSTFIYHYFYNLTPDKVIKCCVSFSNPVFPIVFTCRHLLCCAFYHTDFNETACNRNIDYFYQCPVCRTEVNLWNIWTI